MPEPPSEMEFTQATAQGVPTPLDRRTVSVLFADVAQSTEIIQGMDAEAAIGVLNPVLNAAASAVERFGGTIAKRMGDGFMVLFGVPKIQEDHALRACLAALAIQQEVERVTTEPGLRTLGLVKVRVGVNSGLVVVATSTEGGRVSYDAIGPAVHLASRMETAAEPGTILLAESTYRLARHRFECRPLGAKSLKGFSNPQPAYRLLRAFETAHPTPPPDTRAIAAPLIGRALELAEIEARLTALERGVGSLVLISGEPGIGKTRLLQEARRAVGSDVLWLEGHALSFGQRLTYWPFIEMLKPWLGIRETASKVENWSHAERTILDLMGEDGPEVLPYIATLHGLEIAEPYAERVRYLDAESMGRQIVRAIWRSFERLAQRGPLVLVVDDLHWVDRSSAALLEHLLPLARDLPILFCVTSRSESEALDRLRTIGREALGARFTELALAPLSVAASQSLISSLIGDSAQTMTVRELVLYKAGGNPFFAEELVRALIDTKVLVHGDAGGRLVARDQEIALPDTVHGVIMARVDRLDERLKHVLGIASVIGRSFFYRVLDAVTEDGVELDERLARLKAVEIIDEALAAPERAYLFRHALAQEAIYENVLIERRKLIHGRVAACLETLYADRIREIASLLAFHYARAENWEKALRFLVEAAEQSNRMAADDEALVHYEEAVDAYGRVFGEDWDRDQRANIERRIGEIHLRRGRHAQALAHLCKALSLYGRRLPESSVALRLAVARGCVVQLLHRVAPVMVKPPRESTTLAHDALLHIYEAIAWTFVMTDHRRVTAVYFTVINLADRLGLAEAVSKGSAGFGSGLDQAGLHGSAKFYHRRALRVAEEFQNPSAIGLASDMMGVHHFQTGDWAEAARLFDRGRDFSERAGDLSVWSSASVYKCELLNETGEFAAALEIAERMITVGREAAIQPAQRWGLAAKGKTLRRLGRLQDGEAILREAIALATAASDFIILGGVQTELICHLIHRGAVDEARVLLEGCRHAIREHGIIAHTLVYLHNTNALMAIGDLERAVFAEGAARACRRAHRTARRFRNGLPSALRLLGTATWIAGRQRKATRWWRQSLICASGLGATYQSGLTLAEMGRRMESPDHRERARSVLTGLGVALPDLENPPLL